MRIALGIDTGGTYTDAVLMDHASGQVLASAKALTTRHDLTVGIREAIAAVFAAPAATAAGLTAQGIVLVGLSTTLATNAMVESKAGPVCLLLVGYDPELMNQYGFERELATGDYLYIAGGHRELGDEQCPLDEEAVRRAVASRRDEVEAFAVSGYFGVRNPTHELRAREIIREMTGLPVTCGHELSSRLNAVRRATTAALNARLIAPLQELIVSVQHILAETGISAPLMVVKGDGSLVRADWAMARPIETILSGPAASVVGGWHLAGRRDAWVVDIGGTTTDIAALRDGLPNLNGDGARVGGWRTMVQAIDVHTTGLGGDSHVTYSNDGELEIGPRRVVPLSLLGATHPSVLDALRLQASLLGSTQFAGEFLMRWRAPAHAISAADLEVIERLIEGPLPLGDVIGEPRRGGLLRSRVEDLAGRGLVQRAAFTPTDALHVLGRMDAWNVEAARLGATLLAHRAGMSVEALCAAVIEGVAGKAGMALLSKVLEDQLGRPCDWREEPLAARMVTRALRNGADAGQADDLGVRLALGRPIVAIGAPVIAYMPSVAERLHTELVIPPHAEVANAVGAVVGGVVQRAQITISRLPGGVARVRAFLPDGFHEFESPDAAAAYCEGVMTTRMEELARQAGADQVQVQVTREDVSVPTGGLDADGKPEQLYLGSEMTFLAAGRPAVVASREVDPVAV